jgi:hypothetical protein
MTVKIGRLRMQHLEKKRAATGGGDRMNERSFYARDGDRAMSRAAA